MWNHFSDDFTNVDEYAEFVEVFINNEYKGIYLFMEPINRRNLNLNSSTLTDTSVVLKSSDWNLPNFSGYSNLIEDAYYGYELKYPNDEELFNIAWNSILSKLSKYYNNTVNSSYEQIDEIFNMNNYIDLMLFNSFTNNEDNGLVKNNYYYQKTLNDEIYIQPWDMEFSFGLSYSSKLKNNTEKTLHDYEEIIFDIKHSSEKINKLLANKYWNLKNSILTPKSLDKLLDNYKEILCNGATTRDSNKWDEYDAANDIEEVRTWLHNRIKIYDNYIRGL